MASLISDYPQKTGPGRTPFLTGVAPGKANLLWLGGLGIVLALGAFFRVHELGEESFDCDELYAVRLQGISLRTVGQVVGRDGFHTNHPPLMTVPYLYWGALFGTSETSIRALPCLLGLVSLVLVYRLGKRVGGPLIGLAAATALALNPLHIAYSREARQYAMLVFLTLGAHLFFLRSLQEGRNRDRVVYFAFSLLAIFTHYFAIPALAAHGVVAIWVVLTGRPEMRRKAILALMTLTLAAVPFLAWLPVVKYQSAIPWPHLRGGGTSDIVDCLNEVAGLGRNVCMVFMGAAVSLLILLVAGIWHYRKFALEELSGGDDYALLARWAGYLFTVTGIVAAIVLWTASPTYLIPAAREVLQSYGYDQVIVDKELAVLRLAVALLPATIALQGTCIAFWPGIVGLFERLPRIGPGRPLSAALFVLLILVVPIVLVRLIALLGIPFVSSRNLLILVAPLALAVGMGITALVQCRMGKFIALAAASWLVVAAGQYETLAAPFGGKVFELGMHTGAWRELGHAMRSNLSKEEVIVSIRLPVTDPALYYLDDFKHRRIDRVDELSPGDLVRPFYFLHLQKNYASNQLLKEMVNQIGPLNPVMEVDEFVVYEIAGKPKR